MHFIPSFWVSVDLVHRQTISQKGNFPNKENGILWIYFKLNYVY
jgi:hypothetical protein